VSCASGSALLSSKRRPPLPTPEEIERIKEQQRQNQERRRASRQHGHFTDEAPHATASPFPRRRTKPRGFVARLVKMLEEITGKGKRK
jgi:hypothetical protein